MVEGEFNLLGRLGRGPGAVIDGDDPLSADPVQEVPKLTQIPFQGLPVDRVDVGPSGPTEESDVRESAPGVKRCLFQLATFNPNAVLGTGGPARPVATVMVAATCSAPGLGPAPTANKPISPAMARAPTG